MTKVLFVLPQPDTAGLDLRNRASLAVQIDSRTGRWRWRCPFCDSTASGRLRSGRLNLASLVHETWCPILLNGEVQP
jgi:hypothetical protein